MNAKPASWPVRLFAALLWALLLSSCASDRVLRQHLKNPAPISDARFEETIGELTGTRLLGGNRITELVNGEQFFPAMIEAIRHAQSSIHFENFVWRSGDVSDQFIAALSERARSGVKVNFLVDALGSIHFKNDDWERLRESGVHCVKYKPLRLHTLFSVNQRTHRKILIVDGKIGFVGGISIADEWLYETDNPGRWRDSHYRLEGPAVGQLDEIFEAHWSRVAGKCAVSGRGKNPPAETSGACAAACFLSGIGGEENARRIYLLSIAGARQSIRMAQSYFVPDDLARRLLIEARRRGVRVEVITPGNVNLNLVRRASRSRWKKLLDAGVEFYEYQPAKYHLKLLIVDDVWTTAGSVNFDDRSFGINEEANFIALDREFAATQIDTFEADKKLSRAVVPEEFRRRSIWIKSLEKLAGLLRFQL